MTNEEAIAYFKRHIDLYCVDGICREAEETAIKALEQHPCEDEYIKVPKKALKYRTAGMVAYNAEWLKKHWQIELKVMGIECDDAISCEAVIEWLKAKDIIKLSSQEETARKELKALPLVTPQKYGHWIWNFDKGYCKCSECGIGMGHKEFDYCPNCGAKMQESEDKE